MVGGIELTARQFDVLLLIGRDDRTYWDAAGSLRNRNLRRLDPEDIPSISPRTVEQYATQIRDLVSIDDVPTRALRAFYRENREEIEAIVEGRST